MEYVRGRIARACQRCGRDPSTVTLVAVTKGVDAPAIREAIALGLRDLGENRVQEARRKRETMEVRNAEWGMRSFTDSEFRTPNSELPSALSPVKWHLIGHLQRNKAKEAVELFAVIHSLDTTALAEALERHAAATDKEVEVFIQVNVSGEATKFGCAPDEAQALAKTVMQLPHLRLRGLMTIAPFADDRETIRPIFHQLRGLRDELQVAVVNRRTGEPANRPTQWLLSMGMSQDFETAIGEGADVIRVGTAIFGT